MKYQVGQRLPTKDGRRYTNAQIIEINDKSAILRTDFGNIVKICTDHISHFFHDPFEWGEFCPSTTPHEQLEEQLKLLEECKPYV